MKRVDLIQMRALLLSMTDPFGNDVKLMVHKAQVWVDALLEATQGFEEAAVEKGREKNRTPEAKHKAMDRGMKIKGAH